MDTNEDTMLGKYCRKCEVFKQLSEFNKNKTNKNGLRNDCKSCQSESHKIWQRNNKSHWNAYMRNYNKNPENAIKQTLRSRLCSILKGFKNDHTMNYVGCSKEFLKSWLEYQFTPQMNWLNFGSYWHVDHVLPVSMFDHSNDNAIRECWNWRNLRPLED